MNLYHVEIHECSYGTAGKKKHLPGKKTHFLLSITKILKEVTIDLIPQGQAGGEDIEKMIALVLSKIPAVSQVLIRWDCSGNGNFHSLVIFNGYSDSQYIMARTITANESSGRIK